MLHTLLVNALMSPNEPCNAYERAARAVNQRGHHQGSEPSALFKRQPLSDILKQGTPVRLVKKNVIVRS